MLTIINFYSIFNLNKILVLDSKNILMNKIDKLNKYYHLATLG